MHRMEEAIKDKKRCVWQGCPSLLPETQRRGGGWGEGHDQLLTQRGLRRPTCENLVNAVPRSIPCWPALGSQGLWADRDSKMAPGARGESSEAAWKGIYFFPNIIALSSEPKELKSHLGPGQHGRRGSLGETGQESAKIPSSDLSADGRGDCSLDGDARSGGSREAPGRTEEPACRRTQRMTAPLLCLMLLSGYFRSTSRYRRGKVRK